MTERMSTGGTPFFREVMRANERIRQAAVERGLEVFFREYEDDEQDLRDSVRIALLAALDHYR